MSLMRNVSVEPCVCLIFQWYNVWLAVKSVIFSARSYAIEERLAALRTFIKR